jgi:hypothetical protein
LDYYYEAYSDVKRKETLGQMMLQGQTMAMQQLLAGRDGNLELKPLDIGYSELTKDADKVVEKIYAHIGIPLSQQARKAMRDWEQENSQHKHGVHSHTLQTYGLTTELVESKLAPYMERFKHCF